MNDLISVIVPVYNVEPYLEKCIQSIIEQTYENLEILLIDDGSTDKSGQICEEYHTRDNRIKVIHKENGGLSSARNVGLEKSTAEFIFFLDSDDWISCDCIYLLKEQLDLNNLDISSGGMCHVYPNGKKKRFTSKGSRIYNAIEASYDFQVRQKLLTTSTNKIISKNILYDVRFPLGKINEDEFVTYKLYLNSKSIGYLDKITYYYYQRDHSIMRTTKNNVRFDVIEAFDQRILTYEKMECEELIQGANYCKLAYTFEKLNNSNLTYEQEQILLTIMKEMKDKKFDKLPIIKRIKAKIKIITAN